MGLFTAIPVLIALIVIAIFILNMLDFVSIEKANTPFAKTILIISFLIIFVFVLWFVVELIGPISR
ncbi:MAG: hypothetical protein GXO83_02440 [Chlorobi bacterium]|nr:hypothetical protein [Chlorobiota bacterium]